MIFLTDGSRLASSAEEASVKTDEAAYLPEVRLSLRKVASIESLSEEFFKLGWQLEVLVLQCKSKLDDVIEPVLLLEALIEASPLELLEE